MEIQQSCTKLLACPLSLRLFLPFRQHRGWESNCHPASIEGPVSSRYKSIICFYKIILTTAVSGAMYYLHSNRDVTNNRNKIQTSKIFQSMTIQTRRHSMSYTWCLKRTYYHRKELKPNNLIVIFWLQCDNFHLYHPRMIAGIRGAVDVE